MKLARLESTTASPSRESRERAAAASAQPVRRVEAGEALSGDRERSLQQEVAEIEPKAIGDFEGGERIIEEARQLAACLTRLGDNAQGLVRLQALSQQIKRIDDEA